MPDARSHRPSSAVPPAIEDGEAKPLDEDDDGWGGLFEDLGIGAFQSSCVNEALPLPKKDEALFEEEALTSALTLSFQRSPLKMTCCREACSILLD